MSPRDARPTASICSMSKANGGKHTIVNLQLPAKLNRTPSFQFIADADGALRSARTVVSTITDVAEELSIQSSTYFDEFGDDSSDSSAFCRVKMVCDKAENLVRQMSTATLEREALQNFERFYGLIPGTATLDQVHRSAAMLGGWASASSSDDFERLPEEVRRARARACPPPSVPCGPLWILPPPPSSAAVTPSTPAWLRDTGSPSHSTSPVAGGGVRDLCELAELRIRVSRVEAELVETHDSGAAQKSNEQLAALKQQLLETEARVLEVEKQLSETCAEMRATKRQVDVLSQTLLSARAGSGMRSAGPADSSQSCSTPALEQTVSKPWVAELSHTASTVSMTSSVTSSVSLTTHTPPRSYYVRPAPCIARAVPLTARVHGTQLQFGNVCNVSPFLSARGSGVRVFTSARTAG